MSHKDPFHLELTDVRRRFGNAAASYDEAATVQAEVLDRLLDRLDALVTRPSVILDVGAGTGRGALALSDRFRKAHVIALDLAEPMVVAARQRKPWFRRYDAVCADAAQLPLTDASVDLVFSNLMLQWVDDPAVVFQEFRRVLKPRGLVLFTTFGPDTLHELRDAWRAADDRVHVNRFIDMHDLGDALLRSGFVNPVMDIDRLHTHYPQARDLMCELKAIGAVNANTGRRRGLTGRRALTAMTDAYERLRTESGLPATWEVVFGQAWAPEPGIARKVDGEFRISPAAIKRGSGRPRGSGPLAANPDDS